MRKFRKFSDRVTGFWADIRNPELSNTKQEYLNMELKTLHYTIHYVKPSEKERI
jgi:hypothetical protein